MINLYVSSDCIAYGMPGIDSQCPIALAARTAGIAEPVVSSESMSGIWNGIRHSWELPDCARRLVSDFDGTGAQIIRNGGNLFCQFAPFAFSLSEF